MKSVRFVLIACLLFVAASVIFPSRKPASAGSDAPVALDIVWSPDGRWMAVPSYQGAWFFDLDDREGEPIHLFSERRVSVITFDPTADSRAAIASEASEFEDRDWSIVIVDPNDPDTVETVFEERNPFPVIYDMGFTSDGRYIYNTRQHVLHLHNLETDEHTFATGAEDGDSENWITSVAETDEEGIFMTSTWNNGLKLLDMNQPRFEERIGAFDVDLRIYKIEYMGENTYLIHESDGVYAYNTASESLTEIEQPIEEGVNGFEISSNGQLMAVGGEQHWVLYDLAAETIVLDMDDLAIDDDRFPVVFNFAFNADASQIATLQTDGDITIYDIETGEVITIIDYFERAISYKWG